MRALPQIAMLPDGSRLHLQHGPIDLIVEASGEPQAVRAAYAAAARRFATVLDELCAELSLLRSPVRAGSARPEGVVAARMYDAVAPFAAETFITPMAAVAGAVAEEVLWAIVAATWQADQASAQPLSPVGRGRVGASRPGEGALPLPDTALRLTPTLSPPGRGGRGALARAYVNNGGDIALYLAPGESFRVGLVDRPDRPGLFGTTTITAEDGIAGIATSGWRGRSFSFGIADAATVLAATAAQADAAATIIANAVDLPGHSAVTRVPARELQPDSDLGARPVTRAVGPLRPAEIDEALESGLARAEALIRRGLIRAAALHCAGETRTIGLPAGAPAAAPLLMAGQQHTREVRVAYA